MYAYNIKTARETVQTFQDGWAPEIRSFVDNAITR